MSPFSARKSWTSLSSASLFVNVTVVNFGLTSFSRRVVPFVFQDLPPMSSNVSVRLTQLSSCLSVRRGVRGEREEEVDITEVDHVTNERRERTANRDGKLTLTYPSTTVFYNCLSNPLAVILKKYVQNIGNSKSRCTQRWYHHPFLVSR